jgi:hypothetical protein
MKPLKTKAQIRAEIEQQVSAYIEKGGEVRDVPSGISGHLSNENPFTTFTKSEPRPDRTPLVEVMKELDARKSRSKKPLPSPKRGPRRKLITDDFGEPVRWVWEE